MMTPDDFSAADALLRALEHLGRIEGSFPSDIADQAWNGNDDLRVEVYAVAACIGEALRDIIKRI